MANILIAGGSGLIGSRLSVLLKEKGHEVAHLGRKQDPKSDFPIYLWDPLAGKADPKAVEWADALINLAGTGIAGKRWTPSQKRLIIDTRVKGAHVLLKAMENATSRPEAYISAAAIGYYGDSGDRLVDENSPPGKGFLAEACIAWEAAIADVAASGIRTVGLRTGIVLSSQGGALKQMLLPLRFGINTYYGTGRQWYSWIHIDDMCGLYIEAVENNKMEGIYNAVAPNPLPNVAFAKAMGKAWRGPSLLVPAPEFALRIALGEMADVVLTGSKVSNAKILATGFAFQHTEAEEALRDVLTRKV